MGIKKNQERCSISNSKSSPVTVSKFYDSLRVLKTQCRLMYRRCTCSASDSCFNDCTKLPQLYSDDDETSINNQNLEEQEMSYSNDNEDMQTQLMSSGSGTFHQQIDEQDWFSHWKNEEEVGFVLPSPPPTPGSSPSLSSRRKTEVGRDTHADGDHLFKVIAPPSPFQTYSSSSRPSSSSTFQNMCQSPFVGLGDIEMTSGHPRFSDLSGVTWTSQDGSNFRRPTPRCRSITGQPVVPIESIIVTRPKAPTSSSQVDGVRASQRFQRKRKVSFINWVDLPKSIPLHVNSECVEVMFIPSWSSQSLRRAPCFQSGNVEKIINWTAINQRHERVAMRKRRQLDLAQRNYFLKNNLWRYRRQIGLKSRQLRLLDGRIEIANVQGDISTRFQFIHWLSESKTYANSIGRFFDIQDKRLVAIKITGDKAPQCTLERVKLKLGAVNEIISLIQMDHLNVVQLFTYFNLGGKMHVVLEACDHSLRCEILCASKGVHARVAHGVIYQIINGMAYCHRLGCLHRDLCPENILVTVDGVIKVADFSKSILLSSSMTMTRTTRSSLERDPVPAGSVTYGAPELLALDPFYGVSADVWSIGCILIELLRGRVLWNGESSEEQLLLIHRTVGPLLPQHCQAALIDEKSVNKTLNHHLPKVFDDVTSFIENCLEVDSCKRSTCEQLLEHRYIKRSSFEQSFKGQARTAEEMQLPRMALWELRPQTAPLVNANFTVPSVPSCSFSNSVEPSPPPKMCHQEVNTIEAMVDGEANKENEDSSMLRTKTAIKRRKARPIPMMMTMADRPSYDWSDKNNNLLSSGSLIGASHHLRDRGGLRPEQVYGGGSKVLWNSLSEVSPPKALSKSMQEILTGPQTKKGKITESRKVNNGSDMINTVCCTDLEFFENSLLPLNPRARIQHIINVLPSANWNTVQMLTAQLHQTAKKNPKTFSTHIGTLTTTLLDQITKSPKVSGPAIRILNNICKLKGKHFEPEAERIIESILNKLGGPSFIEKEGNEVLRHLVKALRPHKAVVTLIKFGAHHKISAARLSCMLLIVEALKSLDLITTFGLPGEQTVVQRKFSSSVFHMATRFLRDTNANTRIAARDIYQELMRHPGFWYLYQTSVPEEKRQWVNRLLDEIRRCQDMEKKNIKTDLTKKFLVSLSS